MLARHVLFGLVLVACKDPATTKAQGSPSPAETKPAEVTPSEAKPSEAKPAESTPAESTPAAPAPAAEAKPAEGSAADSTVRVPAKAREELERAIAPYIAAGRKTYPDAKRRYLAGSVAKNSFYVITKLKSKAGEESVFIAVTGVKGDQITGTIASKVLNVAGFKEGDPYTLAERDLLDWMIIRPDGSEEGNVVGKFLDNWNSKPH
jgi:hypothetical protein